MTFSSFWYRPCESASALVFGLIYEIKMLQKQLYNSPDYQKHIYWASTLLVGIAKVADCYCRDKSSACGILPGSVCLRLRSCRSENVSAIVCRSSSFLIVIQSHRITQASELLRHVSLGQERPQPSPFPFFSYQVLVHKDPERTRTALTHSSHILWPFYPPSNTPPRPCRRSRSCIAWNHHCKACILPQWKSLRIVMVLSCFRSLWLVGSLPEGVLCRWGWFDWICNCN